MAPCVSFRVSQYLVTGNCLELGLKKRIQQAGMLHLKATNQPLFQSLCPSNSVSECSCVLVLPSLLSLPSFTNKPIIYNQFYLTSSVVIYPTKVNIQCSTSLYSYLVKVERSIIACDNDVDVCEIHDINLRALAVDNCSKAYVLENVEQLAFHPEMRLIDRCWGKR